MLYFSDQSLSLARFQFWDVCYNDIYEVHRWKARLKRIHCQNWSNYLHQVRFEAIQALLHLCRLLWLLRLFWKYFTLCSCQGLFLLLWLVRADSRSGQVCKLLLFAFLCTGMSDAQRIPRRIKHQRAISSYTDSAWTIFPTPPSQNCTLLWSEKWKVMESSRKEILQKLFQQSEFHQGWHQLNHESDLHFAKHFVHPHQAHMVRLGCIDL